MDKVVLVDKSDREIGEEEKLIAHQKGLFHRAFSILIFNSSGEMLLQKRAKSKYHSGGSWSNACCSHPRPGEKVLDAAHRRLKEELGFDCDIKEIYSFQYHENFGELMENEFDHVLVGKSDEKPKLNPDEAEEFKYSGLDNIVYGIKQNPNNYTFWFKKIIEKITSDKALLKNL
jgi:isopentenyl-diphosphate delta-isomerase